MKINVFRLWIGNGVLLILFFSAYPLLHGQNYWLLKSPEILNANPALIQPSFELDTSGFFNSIREFKSVSIPITSIEFIKIELKLCSNFSPGLAVLHPGILTYCGDALGYSVIIDKSDQKLHIFILYQGRTYFIEPDISIPNLYHLTTGSFNPIHLNENFSCKNQDPPFEPGFLPATSFRSNPLQKTGMRTYRLALAVTGEFARTSGSTKEAVLIALNSHLSRINTVYRLEHSIQFQLIANNDTLIFMDPETDPYSNGNVNTMLEQNPKVLNERIGLNNYDIGHVFGTNGGGVALLGSTCGAFKGAGVSSSFGVYTGLQFYLIPCHEMGHQFNATHIFNFCDNNNETSSSAFEPGSGSTIMSYAGASNCGANYVQGISDPYFHAFSLQQVKTYSRNGIGALCGTEIITLNEQPISLVSPPNHMTIPILTPFELQGNALDDTPNSLTYTWEEMDLGQKSPLGAPAGTAPLFRSIPPDTISTRIFPKLTSILNNQSTITEVLPSITRPLNFRFTVRDNDIRGGGVHWSDIALQSSGQAGPFKITALNTSDTVFRSGLRYLTWQVSNTDVTPIDCKAVDIYLSDDGGFHFSYLLQTQTPNDGGEWIHFPDKSISRARIKIKGYDHVFFDINDVNLVVSTTINPKIQLGVFPDRQTLCAGSSGTYKILAALSTSMDSMKINVLNPLPSFIELIPSNDFIKSKDSINLKVTISENAPPGLYNLIVEAINTSTHDTVNLNILVKIISSNIPLLSPHNNEDQVAVLPIFKWKSTGSQDGFRIELARDPGFTQIVWSRLILSDTMAIPEFELDGNSIYFWRLIPENGCGHSNIPFAVFHTLALACKTYNSGDTPKLISATGTPTVTSTLTIPDLIVLKQIRIPNLAGSHDFVGDLELTLQAPSGDSIVLWTRLCNNLSNFNLSLDDMAPIEITCPLTDRKVHQPLEPFRRLINSISNGNWSLKVRDAMNGAGGSLDGWSLQLCGALEGKGPMVNNNKVLEIIELKSSLLSQNELLILDPDTQAGDIKIQLLSLPAWGILIKNGTDTLKLGSFVTQADVNAGLISFSAKSVPGDTLDFFDFLAIDEKNNWTGRKRFQIKILNDPLSPIGESARGLSVKWYPNPARDYVYFENRGPLPVQINCYSIDGKLLFSGQLGSWGNKQIRLPKSMEGVYILQFWVKNTLVARKLIVLKD